ncbi:Hypothetical protein I596_1265 [Dokdonella koreensis DS-123]|uniref:Uncharacterized protein n=1 Tax=Dokdonella koreensis DS-123 TaxID=1300342 RepID=A0A160DSN9_9GAMM|nr:Hypothetical protein I596_1265 [Dokdonella koreensis DS-123]
MRAGRDVGHGGVSPRVAAPVQSRTGKAPTMAGSGRATHSHRATNTAQNRSRCAIVLAMACRWRAFPPRRALSGPAAADAGAPAPSRYRAVTARPVPAARAAPTPALRPRHPTMAIRLPRSCPHPDKPGASTRPASAAFIVPHGDLSTVCPRRCAFGPQSASRDGKTKRRRLESAAPASSARHTSTANRSRTAGECRSARHRR